MGGPGGTGLPLGVKVSIACQNFRQFYYFWASLPPKIFSMPTKTPLSLPFPFFGNQQTFFFGGYLNFFFFFGQKNCLNFSEDLFFGDHVNLDRITVSISEKTFLLLF